MGMFLGASPNDIDTAASKEFEYSNSVGHDTMFGGILPTRLITGGGLWIYNSDYGIYYHGYLFCNQKPSKDN
ncbi:uncharacterized protein RSE6_10598 [Rhynchosporium secalis]|uniref:Uncharacterized protein n=1 Tax=Rhynchosporium secalis TaxID=38038 RepID=A0A1E1MLU7_RHYSE|nr:uncharacterized protein RSE6_10598 [Rhynchosporium secalis]